MRFFNSTPRIVVGEKSSVSAMILFLAVGHRYGGVAPACPAFLSLFGGALGLGFRLRRRGLGGGLRRVVAAHGAPGVRALLFRNVAERSLVGPLGIFLGLDLLR